MGLASVTQHQRIHQCKYPKDRIMKSTPLTVRLMTAAASTLITLALFQSVATLAQPSTSATDSQALGLHLTIPKKHS